MSLFSSDQLAKFFYNQGVYALCKDNYLLAGEKFHEAYKLNKRNIYLLIYLGIILTVRKNYYAAEKYFSDAIKRDPNYDDAWFYAAENYFKAGNFEQAFEYLREDQETEPGLQQDQLSHQGNQGSHHQETAGGQKGFPAQKASSTTSATPSRSDARPASGRQTDHPFFHFTPSGVSSRTMPCFFNSARMASARAKSFSLRACFAPAMFSSIPAASGPVFALFQDAQDRVQALHIGQRQRRHPFGSSRSFCGLTSWIRSNNTPRAPETLKSSAMLSAESAFGSRDAKAEISGSASPSARSRSSGKKRNS